jgi:O-antigen ligase
LLVFLATGPKALPKIAGVVAAAAASIPVLMMFPAGQKMVGLLPFIGTVEAENIDYRSRLLDNALIVIQRNLWLGSENYRDTPEMQAMIHGEGIIDIVNSYVAVALHSGMVGLALFMGVLLGNAWAVWQCQQRWPHGSTEKLLGRALLASMVGAMVTIFTVSSISLAPIVYWCLAGLCLAYTQTFRSPS